MDHGFGWAESAWERDCKSERSVHERRHTRGCLNVSSLALASDKPDLPFPPRIFQHVSSAVYNANTGKMLFPCAPEWRQAKFDDFLSQFNTERPHGALDMNTPTEIYRHSRGTKDPANHRQPVRHEVVTHVLGTFCYLCLRAGHRKSGAPRASEIKPSPVTASYIRQRSAAVWTGASQSASISPSSSDTVSEQPAISREVT